MVPLTGAAVVAFLLFKTHRPHTLPIDDTKKPSVLIDLDGMISMHMGMPPGGDSHMKQTGMLVISLRGVNFGFWSRLGCSGQSANILSRQGLV